MAHQPITPWRVAGMRRCSVGCSSLPLWGLWPRIGPGPRAPVLFPRHALHFLPFFVFSGIFGLCHPTASVLCLWDSSRLAGRSLVEASSLPAISVRAVSPIPITRCSICHKFVPVVTPLMRYRLSHLSSLVGSRECSFLRRP